MQRADWEQVQGGAEEEGGKPARICLNSGCASREDWHLVWKPLGQVLPFLGLSTHAQQQNHFNSCHCLSKQRVRVPDLTAALQN